MSVSLPFPLPNDAFASFQLQGHEPQMQDQLFVRSGTYPGTLIAVLADGYGPSGGLSARHVAAHLFQSVDSRMGQMRFPIADGFREAVHTADCVYGFGASSALVAVLDPNKLTIGHLGTNGAALITEDGGYFPITAPHVETVPASAVQVLPQRRRPTRGIGRVPWVFPDWQPQLRHVRPLNEVRYVLLGTTGFWEVVREAWVSGEMLGTWLTQESDVSSAAMRLQREVSTREPKMNVSAILLDVAAFQRGS